jgi:alkylhydroperoxidase/carboxymuconolactone decarboxylase family protein YurZ
LAKLNRTGGIKMKNYPPFIQQLEKTDPGLYKLVSEQQDLIMGPGALDIKVKLLIALAIDAYAGSTGVRGISEVLRKMGASDDEIKESLRIAYNIAGNKVLNTSASAFS